MIAAFCTGYVLGMLVGGVTAVAILACRAFLAEMDEEDSKGD